MRNRNTYLEFQNRLRPFEVFNKNLVDFYFKNFDTKRFNEWQKKGYIVKLIKGWYAFSDVEVNEMVMFRWSNQLRKPSYISLESAFSYFGFIPEQTFEIKSMSTLKTITYSIQNKNFTYNSISQNRFFGYNVIHYNQKPISIAHIEKAILDYLYLNHKMKELADFEALRWNKLTLIDWDLFDKYLVAFDNKELNKRATTFKNYML